MRILFVHQSLPGQYLHIMILLRDRGHEVVFITRPTGNRFVGVRIVPYEFEEAAHPGLHRSAEDYDAALRRASAVAKVASALKQEGFTPDLVIGHHNWGEMLNLEDVWPGVPRLGYFEYFHHPRGFAANFDPLTAELPGSDLLVRARNITNLAAFGTQGWGQTPTQFQLSTYPDIFHRRMIVIPEGVDLAWCARVGDHRDVPLALGPMATDPEIAAGLQDAVVAPSDLLVTYVNRYLEPARGIEMIMRALPRLLANPRVKVTIVGSEHRGSYGPRLADESWKGLFLRMMRGQYDESRVHFMGEIAYENHLRLLRRSDCHVYLTYPFFVSWSLREALACGCAIVASDVAPVREFIRDGANGVLVDFFDYNALADRILEVLENRELAAELRGNARAYAREHLALEVTLKRYLGVINRLAGQSAAGPLPSPVDSL